MSKLLDISFIKNFHLDFICKLPLQSRQCTDADHICGRIVERCEMVVFCLLRNYMVRTKVFKDSNFLHFICLSNRSALKIGTSEIQRLKRPKCFLVSVMDALLIQTRIISSGSKWRARTLKRHRVLLRLLSQWYLDQIRPAASIQRYPLVKGSKAALAAIIIIPLQMNRWVAPFLRDLNTFWFPLAFSS